MRQSACRHVAGCVFLPSRRVSVTLERAALTDPSGAARCQQPPQRRPQQPRDDRAGRQETQARILSPPLGDDGVRLAPAHLEAPAEPPNAAQQPREMPHFASPALLLLWFFMAQHFELFQHRSR